MLGASFITRETGPRQGGAVPAARPLELPDLPVDGDVGSVLESFADHLYCWESFASPRSDNPEPFSLQWFLAIEHQRHVRRAPWIPALLEFNRHGGETLLGLGSALGTDWLQYARHGAKVIACNPTAAEMALVRRNFELRGLKVRCLQADAAQLPLADASVDVACVAGLLEESPQPSDIIEQVYRVLKPGGKVLAVVPARYCIDYWKRLVFPWREDAAGRRRRLREYSPFGALPSSNRSQPHEYGRRMLKKLFGRFDVHRIHQRHIRRRDLPWFLRCVPLHLSHRLFGRFLILKAFKPISCAAPLARAA